MGTPQDTPRGALLVRGGRVVDPAQGIDRIDDVLVRDGRVGHALAQEVRGVVADLLQLHQRAQHQAAAADALGLVDALEHVVDHLLVERRLLGRQRDLLARLDQRRQVADDVRVGLQSPQDERPHQLAQAVRLPPVAVALDRQREPPPEVVLRAEVARAAELHDRPQLAQAVLDRRAGERDAELRAQGADGRGLLGGRVLDVLRLVEHHASPLHLVQHLLVARDQGVGGDHHVRALRHVQIGRAHV